MARGAPNIPETSVSLIRAISSDPGSDRWHEMYARYREPMRAFLAARFPTLGDPDDVVQETMVALARRLADAGWRYAPDEKGHFRNYLMGILKHKAADTLARRMREAETRDALRTLPRQAPGGDDPDLRRSALEVALAQLFADDGVSALHKTVFKCVALGGEAPADAARRLGISRANVDKIRSRMVERLRGLMSTLLA